MREVNEKFLDPTRFDLYNFDSVQVFQPGGKYVFISYWNTYYLVKLVQHLLHFVHYLKIIALQSFVFSFPSHNVNIPNVI